MNFRLLLAPLAVGCFAVALTAAEAQEKPKQQASEEEIKARLAEHAAKRAAARAEAEAAKQGKKESQADVPPPAAMAAANGTAKAKTPAENPTVLPKVEVRKGRITELDQKLAKQNKEIAREKQNTKPTALDETLNGSKISRALAIFGGQSSDDRSNIAKERVAMMEEERDLIEAIAQATDKEEKEQLQKTLDSMRALRRELEQSLR